LEGIRPTYFFVPEIEQALARLDGVSAARILSTGSGIDEIHIIASGVRPPKKIVRDIESLLLVNYGLRIDHRCISVVRTDDGLTPAPATTRPQIQSVRLEGGEVQAVLLVEQRTLVGKALVPAGGSELEAAARALMDAIEQMLDVRDTLSLAELQLYQLGARDIIVVLVHWQGAGQEALLVGASFARQDPLVGAARAALDALNRRLVRIQPLN
jgi:hypothetical protein